MQRQLLFLAILGALALGSCHPDNSSGNAKKFLETSYIDSSYKPGDNFFMYINGKWIKSAVFPPTEVSLGAAHELFDRTKARLRGILDSVSDGHQVAGSIEQKVGDLYASGMDSTTIEGLGDGPVKPLLHKIDGLTDIHSVMSLESELQKDNYNMIVGIGISPDQKNSRINIVNLSQTGIGLPDRDYYFRKDSATLAVQKGYLQYLKTLCILAGEDSAKASRDAALVYRLEKEMAASHRTNVELRDPQSNYNKVYLTKLEKMDPNLGWGKFFEDMGIKIDSLDMGQPAYYARLNGLLKTTPIDSWKAYYRVHVLDAAANSLSSPFVNARFDYYGRILQGQQALKPRWERMNGVIDNSLGDGIGQLYVKKYFTEEAKKRILDLVNNFQTAFSSRIDRLDWMSDSTKQVAKDKLHAFLKKVGYTDKWRDYSQVKIDRSHYFDNLISCGRNEVNYQISKIGKPVDRTEWGISAPTIDAYYDPTVNQIVFPAGILQFPFFDPDADDAINYGGIGMVIGHEMTHGFDDQGAQYDKDGNLKNWWGRQDSAKFVGKSKMVINLYNHFTVLDSVHVNGSLTTGENMADIGGVAIAYEAFKLTPEGKDTTRIDGFTPDQRFFISVAQIWRSKLKDNLVQTLINTDPHSPPMYRVNGPLMNMPAFYSAFNVQPGDKMYLSDSARIKIW
jgi:putative endopeptidase